MPETNIFDDEFEKMIEFEEENPEENKIEFHNPAIVVDDSFVEWYLRKKNLLSHEINTIKAQAEAMMAEPWGKKRWLEYKYEQAVESYIRGKFAEDPSRKTFHFFSGTCRLVHQKSAPFVADKDAATQYALERDLHTFLSQPEVKIGEYKKYAQQVLEETGELLPGIDIKPESESFSISFKESK